MAFFATRTRDEFATRVVRERGYRVGVEVGVRDGEFSRHLLETTGIRLYGLDIVPTPGALRLARDFPGRYEFREARSPGAAAGFADGFFDFVHVDADHSYEAVAADLAAWWPKVAPGGCLSGDDYADTDNPGEGRYGVVRAVNEFADRLGLGLRVEGCGPSRAEQLEYARWNGEQASNYLRRLPYAEFQNPCWYVFRPAGGGA